MTQNNTKSKLSKSQLRFPPKLEAALCFC